MEVTKVVEEIMVVVVLAPLMLVSKQIYLQVNALNLEDLRRTLGPLS